MTAIPPPRARPALDREQVTRAALRLLDEVGLDDLTMRRLADRLGVTAASLYWHVRDKSDLLVMLGDAISGEMPMPSTQAPWRQALEQAARDFRRVMLQHRDGARILAASPPLGAQRLRIIDAVFGLLHRSGLPLQDVADAGYLFNTYVVGYVLDEAMIASASLPASWPREPAAGVPLGSLSRGHLVVRQGASHLLLRLGAGMSDLYHLAGDGKSPDVELRGGVLSIKQRHGRHDSTTVTLNAAVPWEVDVEGGAVQLSADFLLGHVPSLHIAGGVSDVVVRLPAPSGVVPISIDGGARRLRLERPYGTAMRVHIRGGSRQLSLDSLLLGSVGEARWESPHAAIAADLYDLRIDGGSTDSTVAVADPSNQGTSAQPAHDVQQEVQQQFAAQPAAYPHLAAVAPLLAFPDGDRRFDVGIRIFLDGLEKRLSRDGPNAS